MTTTPAGWYPDSSSESPQLRWWDGGRWTEHTHAPTAASSPVPGPTTPDGVELATWARRLGAYAIDYAILYVPVTVLQLVLQPNYFDRIFDSMNAVDPETGQLPPDYFQTVFADFWHSLLISVAVWTVVATLYHGIFLAWKSATPGKLIVGIRVRRWDSDAPLTWGRAFARPFTQYGVFGLGLGFLAMLDGLWPLWDQRQQALHDKVVKTVVVRVPTDDEP